MITILHGDDVVTSRNKLTQLVEVQKGAEVLHFDGEKTNLTDIVQAFEASSLFDTKKLLILEGFIQTKDKKIIASVLNHIKKHLIHDVIFWEAKEIKKELLLLFPKEAAVYFFKKPQVLFPLLDAIKPGNTEQMLFLFHEGLKTESPDLLLYMIVRQFRILLGIATHSSVDEVRRLAPWQKTKLERQARLFTSQRLKLLYRKLFQIERDAKTGGSPLSLPDQLDLFLASI